MIIKPRKTIKKKAAELYNEISKKRKIICADFSSLSSRTGYLILTEKALEFYYFKTKNKNNFYILLKDIKSIEIKGNSIYAKNLTITTIADSINFVCSTAEKFNEEIKKIIKNG